MRIPALALSTLLTITAAFLAPAGAAAAGAPEGEAPRAGGGAPLQDRLERLAGARWHAIAGSAMNSVFMPGVDNQPWMRPGSWGSIQAGWSGAVCTGKELVLWGGGHSNGNHNGLLAVNPEGRWRRITEPSPIWTREQCPDDVCPAATGPCHFGKCNTGPDGRPVSRHTYYLLGYHDGAIYSVAGATAPSGAVGEPPRAWRYTLAKDLWEPLPDTPAPLSHGSVVVAGGRLYHSGGWKGMAALDLAQLSWEHRSGSYGGQTGVVYVPTLDRIYILGNGHFEWVERESFGLVPPTRAPRRPGDEILDARHIGLTYDAAEDVILAWNGGRALYVIDPHSLAVTRLSIPGDDPGPALKNGTFGRFSDCGGRLMLVNGVDRPLHVLLRAGDTAPAPLPSAMPTQEPEGGAAARERGASRAERIARRNAEREADSGQAPESERERGRKGQRKGKGESSESQWTPEGERLFSADRVAAAAQAAVAAGESADDETEPGERAAPRKSKDKRTYPYLRGSQPDWLTDPYYPVPPGGSLEAFDAWVDGICGPRGEWSVIDVGPGHGLTDASQVDVGGDARVVIRVHAKDSDHGVLTVKKARCVEVVGVADAQGRRPTINGINMTRGFGGGAQPVVDGGLIVRNMHVRHAKNDCIGSPNDGRFVSIEDSVVEMCGHHGVITGRSPHLYFRSLRTTWRYADSHLVYINRIARSDLIDNVCEAPGWGHCLRSIARVSVVEGNRVSNVALDGSLPPAGTNTAKPKRKYLGMHPIDVYGCSEGRVANNTITYYRKAGTNIQVPINIRYRATFMGCDVAEHGDRAWRLLDPTSAEFQEPATWQRIRAAGAAGRMTFTVRDNVIKVVGPDRTDHGVVGVQGGTLPLMGRDDREGLAEWLRARWSGSARTAALDERWNEMRAALPAPHWKRIADLVLPESRPQFLKGALRNSMPLPVPVGHWFQRQTVRIGPNRVMVCDEAGACRPSSQAPLRPEAIEFIYFGEADPEKQFAGANYRRAIIEEGP